MSVTKPAIGLLYRKCLKQLKHYIRENDLVCREAQKIRDEFDEHRNEVDPGKIDFLVKRTEFWLYEVQHPRPYIIPHDEGGTLFMRYVQMSDAMLKENSQLYDFDKEVLAFEKKYNDLKLKQQQESTQEN
eukprot:gene6889-11051_t